MSETVRFQLPLRRRWAITLTRWGIWAPLFAVQLSELVLIWLQPRWLRFAIGLPLGILLALVVTLVLASRWRPAEVRLEEKVVQQGGRTARFEEFDRARLIADHVDPAKRKNILLILQADRLKVSAIIASSKGPATDERGRRALAQVVEASAIEMPRDKYDPKGKFSSVLFPEYATREGALELLAHPPRIGDDLRAAIA